MGKDELTIIQGTREPLTVLLAFGQRDSFGSLPHISRHDALPVPLC